MSCSVTSTHTHTHTHTHTRMHVINTHTHTHTQAHAHTHIRMHVINTHTYTHKHTHTYIPVCSYSDHVRVLPVPLVGQLDHLLTSTLAQAEIRHPKLHENKYSGLPLIWTLVRTSLCMYFRTLTYSETSNLQKRITSLTKDKMLV